VHKTFDLNFIVKGEGLFMVTGNHVYVQCKSGDILETVLDTDFAKQATNRRWYIAYLIAAIVMTLRVLEGHSYIASVFKCAISYSYCIMQSLCIGRASCFCIMWSRATESKKLGSILPLQRSLPSVIDIVMPCMLIKTFKFYLVIMLHFHFLILHSCMRIFHLACISFVWYILSYCTTSTHENIR